MTRPAWEVLARRTGLFWPLQLGGWTLFGAGMLAAGLSLAPFPEALLLKVPLTVLGFAVSLGLRAIYRGLERWRLFPAAPGPAAASVAVALLVSCASAAGWMAAYHLFLAMVAGWRRGAFSWHDSFAGFPDLTNTIYYSFVLIAWSGLYFGVQAYVSLLSERDRAARTEALAQEARLKALRLQLNPHFLFNTLNAISTLVVESRAEEANRMLGRLAAFLRTTLDRTDEPEISIEEEVDFARRYLEIEEIRFGDRLRVIVDVGAETLGARVPPLILQPLVENAVRHAVLPRVEGGEIAIRAARRDGWLTLAVEDDGPGIEPGAAAASGGVGLANTRQRLAELYGDFAELAVGRRVGGGVAASIRLPFRVRAASEAVS
jgi:two-component system LytT family sensor kinase